MDNLKLSDLNRVMQCTGSLKLAQQVEPRFYESSAKDEGLAAHWAAKEVFNGNFTLDELNDRKTPQGVYITPEISAHVEQYLSEIQARAGVVDYVATRTFYNHEVTGRLDHVALVENTLYVDAFHYGYRLVSPVDNWSMIVGATAYLAEVDDRVDHVVFTVHQPRTYRPSNIPRDVTMTLTDLLKAFDRVSEQLNNLDDVCTTGPACTTCPLQHACSTFSIAAMNAVDVSEHSMPSEPTGEELAYLLDLLEVAEERIKAKRKSMVDLAEHRLTVSATAVPGYSMERKKAALTWNDGMSAEMVQLLTGNNASKIQDKQPMITPTQFKTKYKVTPAIMETLAHRPETAPKLVRLDVSKKADQIFK